MKKLMVVEFPSPAPYGRGRKRKWRHWSAAVFPVALRPVEQVTLVGRRVVRPVHGEGDMKERLWDVRSVLKGKFGPSPTSAGTCAAAFSLVGNCSVAVEDETLVIANTTGLLPLLPSMQHF
ncbi:hypothetical protein Cadr_000025401 [Camelus dromedarius]|uniref:Uncharacterized protein n=1 Tax=Camelus dromedarius TaxID=9838 RepID=A0A5N4CJT1_CAMDR|nr:hypothetical protein Cadr_000025401 [Camelus dromedarius]